MFSPLLQAKKISKEMKTNVISIYNYQSKRLCGTVSNAALETPIPFESAIQFMLLIENMLDEIGFPQRAMDLRSVFSDNLQKNDTSFGSAELLKGKSPDASPLATFELEIIFRQNASWQGSIAWIEENSVFSFRSVLELLILIDSILAGILQKDAKNRI